MKVELTSYGTIWFEDYIYYEGWYHPFHDYIANNYHGFKENVKNDVCVWMVLK